VWLIGALQVKLLAVMDNGEIVSFGICKIVLLMLCAFTRVP